MGVKGMGEPQLHLILATPSREDSCHTPPLLICVARWFAGTGPMYP